MIARRAAAAQLVLRLEDVGGGFELVPCLQGRRATTVMAELAPGDAALDAAAALLQVGVDAVTNLVDVEWAAARRAWPALTGVEPARRPVELDDVVRLLETAAPRLADAGIAVMLPARLGRRRTTSRSYHVQGSPAGLDVASLVLTGEVRIGDSVLSPAELDTLVHAQHDLVSLGGRWTLPGRR